MRRCRLREACRRRRIRTRALNKIRLDVHVTSSPQLDFQNSYAKLAGTVDLTVRGTLAVPSVLGRIQITDGSATYLRDEV